MEIIYNYDGNGITFMESSTTSYRERTFLNIRSTDLTIAFAFDFSTGGEKCTLMGCKFNNKPYFPIDLSKDYDEQIKDILLWCNGRTDEININIAGNGIYTLNKYGFTQRKIDEIVNDTIKELLNNGVNIHRILSGGQTGADEAGIKAAVINNIKCICKCPKYFKFRNIDNLDICSKELFLERFNNDKINIENI